MALSQLGQQAAASVGLLIPSNNRLNKPLAGQRIIDAFVNGPGVAPSGADLEECRTVALTPVELCKTVFNGIQDDTLVKEIQDLTGKLGVVQHLLSSQKLVLCTTFVTRLVQQPDGTVVERARSARFVSADEHHIYDHAVAPIIRRFENAAVAAHELLAIGMDRNPAVLDVARPRLLAIQAKINQLLSLPAAPTQLPPDPTAGQAAA